MAFLNEAPVAAGLTDCFPLTTRCYWSWRLLLGVTPSISTCRADTGAMSSCPAAAGALVTLLHRMASTFACSGRYCFAESGRSVFFVLLCRASDLRPKPFLADCTAQTHDSQVAEGATDRTTYQ